MAESRLRRLETAVFGPPARLLLKAHITPNMVTVLGTIVVAAAALILYPTGHAVAATITISIVAFTDSLDGTMARISGRTSDFGAFLDSTLDRIADAAIFGGMALYFANSDLDDGDSSLAAALCVMTLASALVISYARARAENFEYDAKAGIAERFFRIVLAMAVMLAAGLGAPAGVVLAGLGLLLLACLVTIVQRIVAVYQQAKRGQHPLRQLEPTEAPHEKEEAP